MTPPADKPMDRSEAVKLSTLLMSYAERVPAKLTDGQARLLARAVLAMDEELRKAAESGKEKP